MGAGELNQVPLTIYYACNCSGTIPRAVISSWPIRLVVKLASAPIIRKLHVDSKVPPSQQSDDFLQNIAVFATHTHRIALNGGLDFLFGVLDRLYNFARLFDRNPLLQRDTLAYGGTCRRLHSAVAKGLERHAALYELALKNVIHRFEFVFVNGGEDERVFALELNVGF